MPIVKRIRRRGATITVEAHGEVLFMPGGDVFNWTNRFTGRIRSKTIAAAPENQRPRWSHYGKPLKGTIVSARPRFWANGRDQMRVYGAVGSTAPYAAYVDQGTGVYAGGSPYPAKILPPWTRGSASLYESTWRPAGPQGKRVAPVMIKGQRPQFYFAEGLARAFTSMRMRSVALPGDGGPKITDAMSAVATLADNLVGGNTQPTPGFIAQLEEWRAWRDEAWGKGEDLGRGQRRHRAREKAASARRDTRSARSSKPSTAKPKVSAAARKADKAAFIKAMQKKYGARNVEVRNVTYRNGYWYVTIRSVDKFGRTHFTEVRAKAKS